MCVCVRPMLCYKAVTITATNIINNNSQPKRP